MSLMDMDFLMDELTANWQLDSTFGETLFDDPYSSFEGIFDPVKPPHLDPVATPEHESVSPFVEDEYPEWMDTIGVSTLLQESDVVVSGIPVTDGEDSTNLLDNLLVAPVTDQEEVSVTLSLDELLQSVGASPLDVDSLDIVPVISLDSSQDHSVVDQLLVSSLSSDDIDSILSSSEPCSPESSVPSSPTRTISGLEELLTSPTSRLSSLESSSSSAAIRLARRKVKTVSETNDIPIETLSKKDRKKMQNKNAAIRYRMKKRAEVEAIRGDENVLEDTNKSLKEQVDQLQREIRYMKDLMSEVCKAKKASK